MPANANRRQGASGQTDRRIAILTEMQDSHRAWHLPREAAPVSQSRFGMGQQEEERKAGRKALTGQGLPPPSGGFSSRTRSAVTEPNWNLITVFSV